MEMWSTSRLPYQPNGGLLSMREDLRVALATLEPVQDHVLYGCYTSAVRTSRPDAENILFYNVREEGFPQLCSRGVKFETVFHAPPPAYGNLATQALHHHLYQMQPPGQGFRYWNATNIVHTWCDVTMTPLDSARSPAPVWHAMRRALNGIACDPISTPSFGMRVTLSAPRAFNVARHVKALFDGLISAFHRHNGSDIHEISQRVSSRLGVSATQVSEMLMSTDGVALGPKCLLKRFRDGVQWHPADDKCVAAELLITEDPNGWQLSGELFEVEEG